jgi:hypothetical protein
MLPPTRTSDSVAVPSAPAPTIPADGRVKTHAVAIRPATFQRTSAPRLPTPLPMIDPVATCVVDSE